MRILGFIIKRSGAEEGLKTDLRDLIREILAAIDDEKLTEKEIVDLRKRAYNTLLKHGLDL